MGEHRNAAKIRESTKTIGDRDFDAYVDTFAEDVVAFWPPPFGTLRGKAAVRKALEKFDELSGGTEQALVESVLADDDYAIAFYRGIAERDGKRHDLRFVTAGELNRDGRFKKHWYLSNDQQSHEEFWAEYSPRPVP